MRFSIDMYFKMDYWYAYEQRVETWFSFDVGSHENTTRYTFTHKHTDAKSKLSNGPGNIGLPIWGGSSWYKFVFISALVSSGFHSQAYMWAIAMW